MTDPHIPEDLARSLAYESLRRAERTESGGFSDREEEEFLLHYGPRKKRKALKKRLKAQNRATKANEKLD